MPRKRRPSELLKPGEYEELLAKQDGGCALCGAEAKTRRLHVDHDHRTGRVRGLLCFRCNRFLHSWMTAEWLAAAALYVEQSDNIVVWTVNGRPRIDGSR